MRLHGRAPDRKTGPVRSRAFGGRIFPGGSRDRFFPVREALVGKVATLPLGAGSVIAWQDVAGRRTVEHPAAIGAPRSARSFDWEGLHAAPLDRECVRDGVSLCGSQGLRLYGRLPIRPVLKHGPRSLTCARVMECERNSKAQ